MLDFTKLYGRLAYQSPRTHDLPTPMPTIAEIDDLISREGRMHESLIRIREMILAQQTVMAEQAQEPRIKGLNGSAAEEDAKSFTGNVNSGDPKRRKGVSPVLCPCRYKNETKVNLAVTDVTSKQRAAPPGRCHSCSRAETPEWRRGPDGARTLCNACGLRKLENASFHFPGSPSALADFVSDVQIMQNLHEKWARIAKQLTVAQT